jgi:hypothetical protein
VPESLVSVPQDLSLIPADELTELFSRAMSEFDRVSTPEMMSQENITYAAALSSGMDRIKGEQSSREVKRVADEDAKKFQLEQQRAALTRRVHGDVPVEPQSTSTEPGMSATTIAAAAAEGVTKAFTQILGDRMPGTGQRSLAAASRHAPKPAIPGGNSDISVTASVDIPGVASGSDLTTFDAVVDAFQRRARGLPVGQSGRADGGPRVITIRKPHAMVVDDRTSPATMEAMIRRLVNDDTKEALVAGGGWCAPSENLYGFFNATCTDGLIDLPTIGVSRGGIRFPTSPSLADVYTGTFTSATNPWLWTETDDILTVTGSTNKPCVRVPCPTFNEVRLECYGICLTAGNLTDDAYPEATANYLRLLLAAHDHAMNARIIASMLALSSVAITAADLNVEGIPVTNQVLGALSLASMDYRARYSLCDEDILEVVLPLWLREMIRSDLSWRFGVDKLAVTNQEIENYFRVRRIAPQWVGDWQVRGANQPGNATAQTAWPDTVQFMLYPAGTFIRGDGLTLDLGVVRDSVLNAENDHTAAWTEDCHLVARVGYESRLYTAAISVRGWYENTAAAFADRL